MSEYPNITNEATTAPARSLESPGRLLWRRFRNQRVALFGGGILVVVYFVAIFAGFFAPYRYDRDDRSRFFHCPMSLRFANGGLAVQVYEGSSDFSHYKEVPGKTVPLHFFVQGQSYKLLGCIPLTTHFFGTGDDSAPAYLLGADEMGRDVLSRLLYGSQLSLSIGLVGIILRFGFGMIAGGFAGYLGGWTDTIIMRSCELIMSIPALYLIMALRSTFPPGMSSTKVYLLIVVILSLVGWAGSARVIRGISLSLRERQYVLAARTLGLSPWRIVVRHVLPGSFSYLIVAATLSIPNFILGEVVLSFLGVGVQEPSASWGIMLKAAQNPVSLAEYPWLLAPGVAIFITVLAFNFLGDGLRDALDVKT